MVKNRSTVASETAAWILHAPSTGDYQVQVYVPPVDSLGARTQSATYLVSTPHGPAVRGMRIPGMPEVQRTVFRRTPS